MIWIALNRNRPNFRGSNWQFNQSVMIYAIAAQKKRHFCMMVTRTQKLWFWDFKFSNCLSFRMVTYYFRAYSRYKLYVKCVIIEFWTCRAWCPNLNMMVLKQFDQFPETLGVSVWQENDARNDYSNKLVMVILRFGYPKMNKFVSWQNKNSFDYHAKKTCIEEIS